MGNRLSISAFFLFTITFWLFPLINNSWSQPAPLKDLLGVISIIYRLVGLIGLINPK
jgi:hypothetical protein